MVSEGAVRWRHRRSFFVSFKALTAEIIVVASERPGRKECWWEAFHSGVAANESCREAWAHEFRGAARDSDKWAIVYADTPRHEITAAATLMKLVAAHTRLLFFFFCAVNANCKHLQILRKGQLLKNFIVCSGDEECIPVFCWEFEGRRTLAYSVHLCLERPRTFLNCGHICITCV